jgi:hypothetical protein
LTHINAPQGTPRDNPVMAMSIQTTAARRLRLVRLSLGYESAAAFARAIGYPASTYRRCEHRFPIRYDAMLRLHHAVETIGPLSLNYVLAGDTTRQPTGRPGAAVAIFGHRPH